MTDLQSRIAALSPEKRTLLESRLANLVAGRGSAPEDQIAPRDPTRPTPLAFAQQREWATERLRSANNVSGALRLEGKLDLPLLSRVLTEVVRRHEVLRSTVELNDGIPVQVVQPVTPVPTPVVDLRHVAPEQQDAEVRRHYDAELVRPFDPEQPQKLRLTLLWLAPDTHVALFTTDHAASDGWSMAILIREVVTLYRSYRNGDDDGLPSPAIQFGDFAAWQREHLGEEWMAAELEYWRQALEGIPPRLALPTDRSHPTRPTFSGAEYLMNLAPDVTADLRRFTEREGASLFMVLLASCSVLLQRYTDQDDLVFGSAISGRNRTETEQLIGCFSNLLPLRIQLTGMQTLSEVVSQARDITATAYDHQDLPFDRLIEELAPQRESSQTPLIQMMINVLTAPGSTLELPELRISFEAMDPGPVTVDLSLNVLPRADSVLLQWHYSTELFDADTVVQLGDQFQHILRQVVTAPDTPVEQLDIIGAAASPTRESITSVAGEGFVELFQRQVELAPHALAVVCDRIATSYDDLNRAANRLAHHLRSRGVGRGTAVGVLVDRSPQLAVAILGVLKAGGCYIPLDPRHPPDRIAFMLADSGTTVLVTQQRLRPLTADTETGVPDKTVLLGDPEFLATYDDGNPSTVAEPTSPAYVVYTSGSTGTPKGVVIEHRSLAVFAREVADRLELGPDDRFLQFASPSFDVLAEELFPTWLAGGAVVIPTQQILGGVDLVELVERERLTVMELPTAYWHEWVRELDRTGRDLPDMLRMVIVGGERILPDRIATWQQWDVPLMHVYGITETTVSSTFFRLDPGGEVAEWPNLPIGTALPSADLCVLDRRLRPVPVGGVGELHIGGISLARGYLGRPGLTAQRFIADPDPAEPGQRLYRTGDLVRQRADGNLEFLSRADTQIKIRGFRVEPAEIESALCQHPQVHEAVVAVHEPAPGDRRLVGYVVPSSGTAPGTSQLRRFLERNLPSYLVPSAFVELQALPLNLNGKVDHTLLPAPEGVRLELADEYVAPQSPLQHRLAEIVASVVGVAEVGVHDNFFEVGGDSILAIQVVARAQQDGIRFSPLDLFERPTVAQLAEAVTTTPSIDAEQGDATGEVPLAPLQRWFCTADIAEPHHWNTSLLLELSPRYGPQLVRDAVDQLLAHHDSLRQRFQLDGEQMRVSIAPPGGEIPFDVVDLSRLDDAERSRRLSELATRLQARLDLATGPLLRVTLFKLGAPRRHRLAIIAHRLAVDAASMRILVEDLHTACAQLAAGEQVSLPVKTTSWQSWVRWLLAYAGTPAVQSQRKYWTDLVMTPAGRLPLEGSEQLAANTVATAKTVYASLDEAETEALLAAAPAALNCRVDELLLTALSRTLSGWSAARRHLVDLEGRVRDGTFEDLDLARTVGWLSTIHPVALVCDPDSPLDATLKTVKEAVRAVPSGGIGWQLLRQSSEPVPEAPIEVAFTYDAQPDQVTPASNDLVPATEPIGPAESPLGRRSYVLEIHASVTDGRLTVRWRYSQRLHERETVTRLVDRHLNELRAMIDLSRHAAGPVHTPSDFPLARVDQAQLDGLLDRIATGPGSP